MRLNNRRLREVDPTYNDDISEEMRGADSILSEDTNIIFEPIEAMLEVKHDQQLEEDLSEKPVKAKVCSPPLYLQLRRATESHFTGTLGK